MTACTEGGGHAFPISNSHNYHIPGMSLRDYFAAMALVVAAGQEERHGKVPSYSGVARRAYEFADAMLAERSK